MPITTTERGTVDTTARTENPNWRTLDFCLAGLAGLGRNEIEFDSLADLVDACRAPLEKLLALPADLPEARPPEYRPLNDTPPLTIREPNPAGRRRQNRTQAAERIRRVP